MPADPPNLIWQADQIATWFTAGAAIHDGTTKEGTTDLRLDVGDGTPFAHTFRFTGVTLRDLYTDIANQVLERADHYLLTTRDGAYTFGSLDTTPLRQVLSRVSLSEEARRARRGLMATVALGGLIAATGELPTKIPGFEMNLGAHRSVVALAFVAIVLYQIVAFVVHMLADLARRRHDETDLWEVRTSLASSLAGIRRHQVVLLQHATNSVAVRSFRAWFEHAERQLKSIQRDHGAVRLRDAWDYALPLAAAAVVAGVIAWRFWPK